MSADWRRLSQEVDLRFSNGQIDVVFRDQRRQAVFVDDRAEEAVRLWSVVARPSALASLDNPLLDGWWRNRLSELVGFTIDERRRMIGESWVPKAGLTADEWGFYVRNLAQACDRFEYLLTGGDQE